jgi:CRP-like cAMP-binding protein
VDPRVRFVGPLERTFFLKTLEVMSALAPTELAVLAQFAKENFYRRGTALFRRDQRVSAFHIVVDGRVRVRGAEHDEASLGPEEMLGLLSMLSGAEEGLEAVAEVDTRTLSLDTEDLLDVFEDNFVLLHEALRYLARRMLALRRRVPEGTYLAPAEGFMDCPQRSLDLIERLLFMSRDGSLAQTNADALIELASQARERRFAKGSTLWLAEEPSGFSYILVCGTVSCLLEGGSRSFRCGPGYPLGNLESLCGEPRWYEAVAESGVVTLRVDSDALLDSLEDHFEVARTFIGQLARRLMGALKEQRSAQPR